MAELAVLIIVTPLTAADLLKAPGGGHDEWMGTSPVRTGVARSGKRSNVVTT
jgi:hypothetical protein